MAKKLYEESNIQAIADAIREKNGQSARYKVAEMADAILVLNAGGSGSAATTPIQTGWEFSKVMEASSSYTLGDCRYTSGIFFGSFSGQNMGVGLRSKTKIDLTGVDVLHVEFAAYGISTGAQISVYVQDEIGSSAVAGNVVDRVATADEISAGAMDVDVSAVNGSYYIVMGAIAWHTKTVSIAISKIQADMVYGGTNTGTDSSDATATRLDILYPKTAYVNGVKITGAVPSRAAQTYTPGTANQVIAAGQYLSGAQTIRGDANLVPGNIKSGVSIFGVAGSYAGSAASGGSAQSATGTMVGSDSNDMSFSVDFEPDLVCVCVSDQTAMQANAHMAGAIIVRDLFAQCAYRRASTTAFTNGSFGYDVTGLVRSTALQASYSGGVCTVHAVQGSYKFISDCSYTWTAIKF